MRRINLRGFSAVCRAAEGVAAASPASTKSASHQLVRVALYSTGTNTNSHWRRRWFSGNYSILAQSSACAVAGAVYMASSLTEEVHAKEPLPPKIRPNEVVLYQYEACPFCNKVKGNSFTVITCFLFFSHRLITWVH